MPDQFKKSGNKDIEYLMDGEIDSLERRNVINDRKLNKGYIMRLLMALTFTLTIFHNLSFAAENSCFCRDMRGMVFDNYLGQYIVNAENDEVVASYRDKSSAECQNRLELIPACIVNEQERPLCYCQDTRGGFENYLGQYVKDAGGKIISYFRGIEESECYERIKKIPFCQKNKEMLENSCDCDAIEGAFGNYLGQYVRDAKFNVVTSYYFISRETCMNKKRKLVPQCIVNEDDRPKCFCREIRGGFGNYLGQEIVDFKNNILNTHKWISEKECYEDKLPLMPQCR